MSKEFRIEFPAGWRRNFYLVVSALASAIVVQAPISFWLWQQAKPFAPPEGHVFAREVLKGTYVHQAGVQAPGIYSTYIGNYQILCNHFSYYFGTFFSSGGKYTHCYLQELHGQEVEAERVQVPQKLEKKYPMVVKLTAGGKTYIDMSDRQIRDWWLKSTQSWSQSNVLAFILFPVMALVTFLVDKFFFKARHKGDKK
jgi:hypothetical protein